MVKLMMKKMILVLLLILTRQWCASISSGTLRGQVFYMERMAVPPTAILRIEMYKDNNLVTSSLTPCEQAGIIDFEFPVEYGQLQNMKNVTFKATIENNGESIFSGSQSIGSLSENINLRLIRTINQ